MNEGLLYFLTYAKYEALETKDQWSLYFTDDNRVFKGDQEITKTTKIVDALPEAGQVQGVIYINTTTKTAHVWAGNSWIDLNVAAVETVDAIADDTEGTLVPNVKAVRDYVVAKIADVNVNADCVSKVAYADGVLNVTTGTGEDATTENVALTGVVKTPSYDAATRTITLPMVGAEDLVIALGKDAFVESGSYDAEKNTIELTLTSGQTVEIPVADLVDVYTAAGTDTATTTITDNTIKVDVKVSTTAGNALAKDAEGLFVDGSKFADAAHATDTTVHVTAEQKTAWDAKVDKDALDKAIAEVTGKITWKTVE